MHRSTEELEAFLPDIQNAPTDGGTLQMIVRRPAIGEREILEAGELNTESGLAGDNWLTRGTSRAPDGPPVPDAQITIMNSRATSAIAVTRERWALAGDQLYVDMDISVANLPPGTRLGLGDAVLEISEMPHTGCAKFAERFGARALRFAHVGIGSELRLRGVNARVIADGAIQVGDTLKKL